MFSCFASELLLSHVWKLFFIFFPLKYQEKQICHYISIAKLFSSTEFKSRVELLIFYSWIHSTYKQYFCSKQQVHVKLSPEFLKINIAQTWDSLFSNYWAYRNYFYTVLVTPKHYCFVHGSCTPCIFPSTRNNCIFGLSEGKSVKGEEMSWVGTVGADATPGLKGGQDQSGKTTTAACGALGDITGPSVWCDHMTSWPWPLQGGSRWGRNRDACWQPS